MSEAVEYVVRASEIFVVLGTCWKVVRATNRIMDVLRFFPPHRHTDGGIDYPPGWEPGRFVKETR